jgi:hypothetical protein
MNNIDELTEQYERGESTLAEVSEQLLALSTQLPIDDIVASVPESLRDGFVDWLHEMYDNDLEADDFVWISSSGAPRPYGADTIERAREWLRRTAGSGGEATS